MKVSVPILELAVVASLFFSVPMASVAIDVACMMRSHGHQGLPLRRMVEIVTAPPQIDFLKRDHAARVRREVLEALNAPVDPDFMTSDPHASSQEDQ